MGLLTRRTLENGTLEDVLTWARRINGTPNLNKAHCYLDGVELQAGGGFAVALPDAGVNPRYLCPICRRKKLSYHGNAMAGRTGIGTIKKGALENTTVGCELEVVNAYADNAYLSVKVMLQRTFNVIEENDGTVDGEFPTDYMFGANRVSKQIRKFEQYGLMPYFDNNRCGAHIHGYIADIKTIRNWYHTLFLPLYWFLSSHSDEWLIERFGRSFGRWCHSIDRDTEAEEHANFVNTQHSKTLEFRLPRLRNAEQYLNCVYFWREVCYTLNCVEWIPRTSYNREARKAQAEAAAAEIVDLARAYFGE